MDRKDVLQAIMEGKDFDFIANNYSMMSKSDLADLYKELNYSIYTFLPSDEYKRFLKHYIESVEENFIND